MNLSEELNKAIERTNLIDIHIGGLDLSITDTVVSTWILMAVIILLAMVFTRNFQRVPTGKQNVVESIVEFMNKFCRDSIGHHWKTFAPYLGTILIFLAISNISAIFSILPTGEELYKLTGVGFFQHMPQFKLRPPTKDINVTVAMALMSILTVIFAGIRFKKMSGWLHTFIEPMPIVLPFKILEYFIRPLSLSLRLFGNMLGGFIVMELIYIAMPILAPAALSVYFDLFDGLLQAYVFVFLSSLYISEAIE